MRTLKIVFASFLGSVVGGGCFGFGGSGPASTPSPAPYDPCAPSAVIDLDRAGNRQDSRISITRDNELVGSMAPLGSSCGLPTGHQVVFRFTPRRNGRLYITTNGTTTNFDTVVWVLDRCAASGASEIGCNDDGQEAPAPLAATMVTTAPVPAGAPVFIVVAGYRGGRTPSQGTFGLTVIELAPDGAEGGGCRPSATPCDGDLRCGRGICTAPVPVGGGCDPMHECMDGASCMSGTCVALGSNGGQCRASEPRCNEGLVCGQTILTPPVCGRPIPIGSPCSHAAPTCAIGSSCAVFTPTPRCAADGAPGGRCRGGETCNEGLVCQGGLACARPVADGQMCDRRDLSLACVGGADCVPTPSGDRCARPGTRDGFCRAASTGMPCDDGLVCRDLHCVP